MDGRLILYAACLGIAWAQTPDSAAVRGRITDPTGAVLTEVAVELTNRETGLRRTTTSDNTGQYAIGQLPLSNSYRIRFTLARFAIQEENIGTTRAGETVTIDAALAPEQAHTEVTVNETAERFETDSPDLTTRLDRRIVANTPVLGRKLTSLALLDSSVRPARGTGDLFLNNTLFVMNGAGRRQTTYVIDGSTGDDAWGRQTLFTNVPLTAVYEFTIITNSFSAEYGWNAGSAVNVNTSRGTNALHGDALFLWRPGGPQARPPLGAPGTSDRLDQFSGSVSGPLIRNRTHSLVAAEYNRQDRDSTITSPLAPGVYLGRYRQRLGLFRLDHQLTQAHSAALRLGADTFEDTNPQDAAGGLTLPSAARVFRRGAYTAQLSDTFVLSPRLLNTARAVWELGSPITQFDPVTSSTQYVRPGVGTEGESRLANLENRQWQMADTVSLSSGSHNLRLGADTVYSRSGGVGQEFGTGFVLGQFTLQPGRTIPIPQLRPQDIQRYTQSFGNASYRVSEWLASTFVQDDWRMRPSLSLNLGARYDNQSLTGDRAMWSPRAGFAWSAGSDHRTVVRGSYAVFYSQIRANIAANYSLGGPEGIFTFTAAPGQPGFPLDLNPLPAFPAGAVLPARDITVRPGDAAYLSRFLDVSKLAGYPDRLLNPRTLQGALGVGRELASGWFLTLDYIHQHTTRIDRPLDVNPPALFVRTAPGQIRSAAEADATRPIRPVPGGYRRVTTFVNDGMSRYDALRLNLQRRLGSRFSVLASYTYSHAINTVEPDVPSQDPQDAQLLGRSERATSLLNQTHRGVVSGWWMLPGRFSFGGIGSLASGRPFNITTGVDNNGDGVSADRPVVNGSPLGRNAGRGSATYDVSPFLSREFAIAGDRLRFELRAEAFNLLNHANIYGRNAVWGNAAIPLPTFGQPLGGLANVEPGRMLQFQFRARF